MYFNDSDVPVEFSNVADALRANINIEQQNIWLWDEKSAQAMVILNRKSKKKYRKLNTILKQVAHVLTALLPVFWCYHRLRRRAFTKSVLFTDKIGIALTPDYADVELALLSELHNIPVLIRIACHESPEQWHKTLQLIDTLHKKQIKISVALLQHRQAVINPDQWREFLATIIPTIHTKVEWIEIGHAINRVKWGLWSADEYYPLIEISHEFQQRFPQLRLTGPAVIDFEWPRVIDALKTLPKKFKFYALSQHLYVDRRGAPENYQGQFSTIEKCAMLKAIAKTSKHCVDRVIISEVNWPLQDTGIWSPIGSPYTAPEWFTDRPGVCEDDYANYLVRYLALSLCSGFIDQVFWWRLSAHGFGLIDDQNNFRKRPAFYALKTLIEQIGSAKFIKKLPSLNNTFLLQFKHNNQVIILAWAINGNKTSILPQPSEQIVTRDGALQIETVSTVTLTEQPIYIYQK